MTGDSLSLKDRASQLEAEIKLPKKPYTKLVFSIKHNLSATYDAGLRSLSRQLNYHSHLDPCNYNNSHDDKEGQNSHDGPD